MVNLEAKHPINETGSKVVDVIRFTDEERKKYWDILKSMGLWYEPYANVPGKESLVVPYGEPFVLSRELAKKLTEAAIAFREIGRDVILSDSIFERVMERAPTINGISMASDEITRQLQEKVKNGMGLPINYDIILANDKDGNIVPKVVEIQLAASAYVGWYDLSTKAAINARPEILENYLPSVGKPVESLRSLNKIVPDGEEIVVMDFNPLNGPTAADCIEMAKTLGNENSLPVSISDLRKDENGKWVVGVRDRNTKEIIKEIDVKNVLCRSLQGDIDGCLKAYPEKAELLKEFFLDSKNINWIWHPSFQEIINKKDLGLLSGKEATRDMETKTFVAGEKVVGPGKFFYKFLGGNSGKGVEFKELKKDEEFMVADHYVLQEAINIAPISMPVIDPKTGEETTMLATIEIRTMPPFNYGENVNEINTFFLARLNFRRVQDTGKRYLEGDKVDAPGVYRLKDLNTGEFVDLELGLDEVSTIPKGYEALQTYGAMAKTNVGEIMANLKRLVDRHEISYEEGMNLMRAFGFPPVFIENKK